MSILHADVINLVLLRQINARVDSMSFMEMVKNSCQQECVASPMRLICLTLNRLKQHIKEWNHCQFGNNHSAVKNVEAELVQSGNCLQEEMSESAQEQLNVS